MHWTEDGKIQVTKNFAIGAAATGKESLQCTGPKTEKSKSPRTSP